MSNALTALNNDGLSNRQDEAVFSQLTIVGGFLPRVQLYTGRSKYVETGAIGANHWGIITGKDKIDSIGKSFNAVSLAWRPMGLDLTGKKAVSYYKASLPEFRKCLDMCDVKDSNMMCGTQYLLYIQDRGFGTFFAGSKSAKMMATTLRDLMNKNKFLTFSSTLVTGKFTYQAPIVNEATVEFDLPSFDEMKEQRNKFVNVAEKEEKEKDLEGMEANQPTNTDPAGADRVR